MTRADVTSGSRRLRRRCPPCSGSSSSVGQARRRVVVRDGHRDLRRGPGQQVGAAGRAVGAERRAAAAVGCRPYHHRGVGGWQRGGRAVHHVGHDAGDVVRAAAPDGQLDELQDHLVQVLDLGQRPVQGLLADHPGQPVRAEQVPVAQPGLAQRQVRLDVGPAVQGAQQHGPLWVGGHVVRADPALVNQRLDQRVVVRDLVELPVPQQVRAGVPDVHQGHPRAGPEHGGQRGAHALQHRVGHHHVVQRVVRVRHGVGQRVEQVVAGHVVVQLGHGRDGRGTGYLAGGMAAHAVRDGQQARPGIRRVLVPLPEKTDVRTDRVPECKCHLRNSRTVLPMRIGTPVGTGVGWVTFCLSR